MTITPTKTLQIGHLINGEMTSGDNFRDHRDPGRLTEVVARLAVGTPDDAVEVSRPRTRRPRPRDRG